MSTFVPEKYSFIIKKLTFYIQSMCLMIIEKGLLKCYFKDAKSQYLHNFVWEYISLKLLQTTKLTKNTKKLIILIIE